MKLTTLDEDLRIHQKLEDEPNDVGGLSAQELKKKFDQAGVTIQKYLNETHLPEAAAAVADALSEAKAYADNKAAAVVSNALSQAKTYADTKAAGLAEGLEQVRAYTDTKAGELADELSLAKAHTDEKAAELTHELSKAREYIDEQIQELKVGSRVWVASGSAIGTCKNGQSKKFAPQADLVDWDELWDDNQSAFIAPSGARLAVFFLNIKQDIKRSGSGWASVLHNGKQEMKVSVRGYAEGTKYKWETLMLVSYLGSPKENKIQIQVGVDENPELAEGEEERISFERVTAIFFS